MFNIPLLSLKSDLSSICGIQSLERSRISGIIYWILLENLDGGFPSWFNTPMKWASKLSEFNTWIKLPQRWSLVYGIRQRGVALRVRSDLMHRRSRIAVVGVENLYSARSLIFPSDTTASSDAENTAPKRRCLSVTFPDQQSTSSACFTRSHSCVETAKVSNGIHDCLPTVTLDVPPYRNVEEPSIQSLATYHYVESYKVNPYGHLNVWFFAFFRTIIGAIRHGIRVCQLVYLLLKGVWVPSWPASVCYHLKDDIVFSHDDSDYIVSGCIRQ